MAHDQERQERQARLAYIESVRALNRAMNAWHLVDLNLDPRSPTVTDLWSREQIVATQTAAAAWQALVARRREYDATRRQSSARR